MRRINTVIIFTLLTVSSVIIAENLPAAPEPIQVTYVAPFPTPVIPLFPTK